LYGVLTSMMCYAFQLLHGKQNVSLRFLLEYTYKKHLASVELGGIAQC